MAAAIPETEAEDRLMGEAADQLKEKAQSIASDQLQLAKTVGQHMVDETAKMAKQELSSAVENLSGSQNQQGGQQDNQQNMQQGQDWQSGQNQQQNQENQSWQNADQRGLQTDEQNTGSSPGPYADNMGDPRRPIH